MEKKTSVLQIEKSILDDLEVVSMQNKRARVERSTTTFKLLRGSRRKSSNSSCSRQRIKKGHQCLLEGGRSEKDDWGSQWNAEKPPQRREAEFRPMVHSGFDDRFSGKLPPCYIEPLMDIGKVGGSWVFNRRQIACFHELSIDEKYKHRTCFCARIIFEIFTAQISSCQSNPFHFYETLWWSIPLHLQWLRTTMWQT